MEGLTSPNLQSLFLATCTSLYPIAHKLIIQCPNHLHSLIMDLFSTLQYLNIEIELCESQKEDKTNLITIWSKIVYSNGDGYRQQIYSGKFRGQIVSYVSGYIQSKITLQAGFQQKYSNIITLKYQPVIKFNRNKQFKKKICTHIKQKHSFQQVDDKSINHGFSNEKYVQNYMEEEPKQFQLSSHKKKRPYERTMSVYQARQAKRCECCQTIQNSRAFDQSSMEKSKNMSMYGSRFTMRRQFSCTNKQKHNGVLISTRQSKMKQSNLTVKKKNSINNHKYSNSIELEQKAPNSLRDKQDIKRITQNETEIIIETAPAINKLKKKQITNRKSQIFNRNKLSQTQTIKQGGGTKKQNNSKISTNIKKEQISIQSKIPGHSDDVIQSLFVGNQKRESKIAKIRKNLPIKKIQNQIKDENDKPDRSINKMIQNNKNQVKQEKRYSKFNIRISEIQSNNSTTHKTISKDSKIINSSHKSSQRSTINGITFKKESQSKRQSITREFEIVLPEREVSNQKTKAGRIRKQNKKVNVPPLEINKSQNEQKNHEYHQEINKVIAVQNKSNQSIALSEKQRVNCDNEKLKEQFVVNEEQVQNITNNKQLIEKNRQQQDAIIITNQQKYPKQCPEDNIREEVTKIIESIKNFIQDSMKMQKKQTKHDIIKNEQEKQKQIIYVKGITHEQYNQQSQPQIKPYQIQKQMKTQIENSPADANHEQVIEKHNELDSEKIIIKDNQQKENDNKENIISIEKMPKEQYLKQNYQQKEQMNNKSDEEQNKSRKQIKQVKSTDYFQFMDFQNKHEQNNMEEQTNKQQKQNENENEKQQQKLVQSQIKNYYENQPQKESGTGKQICKSSKQCKQLSNNTEREIVDEEPKLTDIKILINFNINVQLDDEKVQKKEAQGSEEQVVTNYLQSASIQQEQGQLLKQKEQVMNDGSLDNMIGLAKISQLNAQKITIQREQENEEACEQKQRSYSEDEQELIDKNEVNEQIGQYLKQQCLRVISQIISSIVTGIEINTTFNQLEKQSYIENIKCQIQNNDKNNQNNLSHERMQITEKEDAQQGKYTEIGPSQNEEQGQEYTCKEKIDEIDEEQEYTQKQEQKMRQLLLHNQQQQIKNCQMLQYKQQQQQYQFKSEQEQVDNDDKDNDKDNDKNIYQDEDQDQGSGYVQGTDQNQYQKADDVNELKEIEGLQIQLQPDKQGKYGKQEEKEQLEVEEQYKKPSQQQRQAAEPQEAINKQQKLINDDKVEQILMTWEQKQKQADEKQSEQASIKHIIQAQVSNCMDQLIVSITNSALSMSLLAFPEQSTKYESYCVSQHNVDELPIPNVQQLSTQTILTPTLVTGLMGEEQKNKQHQSSNQEQQERKLAQEQFDQQLKIKEEGKEKINMIKVEDDQQSVNCLKQLSIPLLNARVRDKLLYQSSAEQISFCQDKDEIIENEISVLQIQNKMEVKQPSENDIQSIENVVNEHEKSVGVVRSQLHMCNQLELKIEPQFKKIGNQIGSNMIDAQINTDAVSLQPIQINNQHAKEQCSQLRHSKKSSKCIQSDYILDNAEYTKQEQLRGISLQRPPMQQIQRENEMTRNHKTDQVQTKYNQRKEYNNKQGNVNVNVHEDIQKQNIKINNLVKVEPQFYTFSEQKQKHQIYKQSEEQTIQKKVDLEEDNKKQIKLQEIKDQINQIHEDKEKLPLILQNRIISKYSCHQTKCLFTIDSLTKSDQNNTHLNQCIAEAIIIVKTNLSNHYIQRYLINENANSLALFIESEWRIIKIPKVQSLTASKQLESKEKLIIYVLKCLYNHRIIHYERTIEYVQILTGIIVRAIKNNKLMKALENYESRKYETKKQQHFQSVIFIKLKDSQRLYQAKHIQQFKTPQNTNKFIIKSAYNLRSYNIQPDRIEIAYLCEINNPKHTQFHTIPIHPCKSNTFQLKLSNVHIGIGGMEPGRLNDEVNGQRYLLYSQYEENKYCMTKQSCHYLGYKVKQQMKNYLLIIQPEEIGEKQVSRPDKSDSINKICIRYVGSRQANVKIQLNGKQKQNVEYFTADRSQVGGYQNMNSVYIPAVKEQKTKTSRKQKSKFKTKRKNIKTKQSY